MNRSSRVAVAAGIVAFALSFVPAQAQYANEFSPAKRLAAGTTSQPIGGKGMVIVQVQVNPDGSHKAIKIIKSTNPANNKAAMELAQSATYRPAHRGSKAVVSFYDYTLKFTSKGLAADATDSGALGQIRALIRSGNFPTAKSKAATYVLSNPGDSQGRILLGLADYYAGDIPGSAAAFAAVPSIDKKFQVVAAQSFAGAAVKIAATNPSLAFSYGTKAYALDKSTNSLFALGVAQLNSPGKAADAVVSLKKARDDAFAMKTTNLSSKINLDSALLSAYQKVGDTANVQVVANEIKTLDPSSKLPGAILGNAFLEQARTQRTAKNWNAAVALYDQAAAAGNPDVAVTADAEAALTLQSVEKPDYAKVKAYADKALAIKSDDALANYAEAVAYTGIYYTGGKKDADKASANSYAAKAIQYARAAGNEALALAVESFVKTNLK